MELHDSVLSEKDSKRRSRRFEPQYDHDTENWKVIEEIKEGSFEDRAYGSIIGAFIGDAMGSYLEFSMKIASEDVMD